VDVKTATWSDATGTVTGRAAVLLHELDTSHLQARTAAESRMRALSGLLEAAKRMIEQTSITPDVERFADTTLGTLADRTIPAIEAGHDTDLQLLNDLWTAFDDTRDQLAQGEASVVQFQAEEHLASVAHKGCRNTEQGICFDLRQCEEEMVDLWDEVYSQEREFGHLSGGIDAQWCAENANGTTLMFRASAEAKMSFWITHKMYVDEAWAAYHVQVPICQQLLINLQVKTTQCDQEQLELEAASCELAHHAADVAIRLRDDWTRASFAYSRAVASVRQQEQDRIQEYTTLRSVQCLMSQIHDRTERSRNEPCDNQTHPEETAHDIDDCITMEFDISHLQIDYNSIPPEPPAPTITAYPCTEEYVDREYAEFFGMEDDVTQTKTTPSSSCVATMPCTACTLIPTVPPAPVPVEEPCDEEEGAD